MVLLTNRIVQNTILTHSDLLGNVLDIVLFKNFCNIWHRIFQSKHLTNDYNNNIKIEGANASTEKIRVLIRTDFWGITELQQTGTSVV